MPKLVHICSQTSDYRVNIFEGESEWQKKFVEQVSQEKVGQLANPFFCSIFTKKNFFINGRTRFSDTSGLYIKSFKIVIYDRNDSTVKL
jgi:hypothetical protein